MPVVNAREYRQRTAPRDTIALPSGGQMRIRKIDLLALAAGGKVDATSVDQLLQQLPTWTTLAPAQLVVAVGARIVEAAAVIDAIVCAAALQPRVLADPAAASDDADALWIEDVTIWDKLAILSAVGRLERGAAPLVPGVTTPVPPAQSSAGLDEVSALAEHISF